MKRMLPVSLSRMRGRKGRSTVNAIGFGGTPPLKSALPWPSPPRARTSRLAAARSGPQRDERLRRAGLEPLRADAAGALLWGENTTPLARFALIAQREQMHVANYPARPAGDAFDLARAIEIRSAAP